MCAVCNSFLAWATNPRADSFYRPNDNDFIQVDLLHLFIRFIQTHTYAILYVKTCNTNYCKKMNGMRRRRKNINLFFRSMLQSEKVQRQQQKIQINKKTMNVHRFSYTITILPCNLCILLTIQNRNTNKKISRISNLK